MTTTISENARKVLDARYIDREHDKNPEGMFKRVSMGNKDYYDLMSNLYFLPNSPTMFNMGLPTGGTSSACFTEDTVIHTLGGDFTVRELIDSGRTRFEVFSTDGKSLKIGKAYGLRKTRSNAKVYLVTFDTGESIKLTGDHLVMMRDGSYKEVRKLKRKNSVMPFNYSYWNFKGYLRRHVCPNIDDRRIAAYRWVFREIHGRDVKPGHDIHHINHNPQDDSSDNLEELSNSQHASHHISDDNPMWRPEVAAKISEHMIGNKRGVGPKPGTAEAMKGNQHALKTEPHLDPRKQYQREWARRRSRLKQGLNNHKVVSVEYIGREDVYDLSVKKYHNFAANGVFIHNCFVFDVDDSLLGDWPAGGLDSPFPNSILGTLFKAACVAKAGGGVGYYFGKIRRKGALVHSTHKKACGPVQVLKLYQQLRSLITQGGKRDLAQMGILPCWHPDILEFIHAKDEDPKSLESFNISVSWLDSWLKKVDFDLYKRGPQMVPTMGETNIWWEQCRSAWRTGCPGMFFWDTVNMFNATPNLGDINAPNPCGETPNLSDEPCNLGSIALPRMLIIPDGGGRPAHMNWEALKEKVRCSIRFLDDILDNNTFPHPDITKMALATRKLGLGVMGWADVLALMHVPYDSNEAVALGEQVMKVVNDTALDESVQLAKSKGAYPAYPGGPQGEDSHWQFKLDSIVPNRWTIVPRCRNSTRTSIAPTGTIALIADVYPSIEPYYTLEDGERTTFEGIKLYEGIPEWVKKHLGDHVPKTAKEIAPEWHIKHQAAFQKHTNLGVSKTINMPNSAKVEDISNAYKLMWETQCKGGTIFRDGCRDEQVLREKPKKASVYTGEVDLAKPGFDQTLEEWLKNPQTVPPRNFKVMDIKVPNIRRKPSKTRQAKVHQFSINQTKCYLTVGLFDDGKPAEIFLTVSRAGSTLDGMLDTWAKMVSNSLQYGMPLTDIVRMHEGTRFEPMGMTDDPDIKVASSIPDYVVRWLEKEFDKTKLNKEIEKFMEDNLPPTEFSDEKPVIKVEKLKGSGVMCPDCGTETIYESGCLRCIRAGCGWNRCG